MQKTELLPPHNVITGGSNNNMESLRLSINILWHLQPKENLSNG
jgi:hypothetical protein